MAVITDITNNQRFTYCQAKSVKETCDLLNNFNDQAVLLAGGTDLMIKIRSGKIFPKMLIDIKKIKELQGIRFTDTQIVLGPLATLAEVEQDTKLRQLLPILPRTAIQIGSPQVRNRGTVGGNLCNGSPSADMAPILLVLGTRVKYRNWSENKTISLTHFFTGAGTTVLGNKGLLTAIMIPMPDQEHKVSYKTLTLREAMDLSIVSAAAVMWKKHGIIKKVRLALGAVAPTPIRALAAEKTLVGKQGNSSHIRTAAEIAASECDPISDVRASKEYRREMIKVVTRQVLEEVLE